jgi:adenylate cyclase
MAEERLQRRLAAIFSADVVGYSRLMGIDEAGTLARLKAMRRDLIDPLIAAHSGRTFKLMGDGTLVEFASAVDAVTCAIEVQKQVRELNFGSPEDSRIQFRIGINVGDIIVDGDDIYGDGVNCCRPDPGTGRPGRHLHIARGRGAGARQGPDQNRDARGADRQKYCAPDRGLLHHRRGPRLDRGSHTRIRGPCSDSDGSTSHRGQRWNN